MPGTPKSELATETSSRYHLSLPLTVLTSPLVVFVGKGHHQQEADEEYGLTPAQKAVLSRGQHLKACDDDPQLQAAADRYIADKKSEKHGKKK